MNATTQTEGVKAGHTKGPCSCMSDTNKMLGEEHNTILAFTFGTPSRAVISTMKLDPSKRGKPVAMIASFCPFCGESYARAKVQAS